MQRGSVEQDARFLHFGIRKLSAELFDVPYRVLQEQRLLPPTNWLGSRYYFLWTHWNAAVFWGGGRCEGGKHTKTSLDLHCWYILNLSDNIWLVAKAASETKGAKYQCNLRIPLAETQQIFFFPVKAFNGPCAFMQSWMSECWSCPPGASGTQARFSLQWSWNQ